jgi:hypothetical protein
VRRPRNLFRRLTANHVLPAQKMRLSLKQVLGIKGTQCRFGCIFLCVHVLGRVPADCQSHKRQFDFDFW